MIEYSDLKCVNNNLFNGTLWGKSRYETDPFFMFNSTVVMLKAELHIQGRRYRSSTNFEAWLTERQSDDKLTEVILS